MCTIYLYAGRSQHSFTQLWPVNPHSARNVCTRLINYGIDPNRIKVLNNSEDLSKALLEEKGILIIPGGQFSELGANIQGNILAIQQAVARGWNYLGLGTGGELASKEIVCNEKGISLDEENNYLLGLLNVRTVVHLTFERRIASENNNQSLLKKVCFLPRVGSLGNFPVFWKDKLVFDPLSVNEDIISLGSYEEEGFYGEIGAVQGKYHKGKVLLFGFNPEYDVEKECNVEMTTSQKESFEKFFGGILDDFFAN